MKSILILSGLLLSLSGQAQKTMWVKTITGQASQVSPDHKVCTDRENNFYLSANFTDNIMFGENIVLKSKNKTGPTDAFIAKIDPDGEQVLWGRQISGFGNIIAKDICTDGDMNVFVTGSFEDKTNFGSVTLTPKVKTGFYIAKYDSDGEFLWVKQGGNYYSAFGGSCSGTALTTDAEGNVYLAANVLGMYADWKHDPSLPVEEQYLGKAYYEDIEITAPDFYTGNHTLLLKLSPEGEIIWKRVAGLGMIFQDLEVDNQGNSYLAGAIGGNSSFEGKALAANGLSDILVLKLGPMGETVWMKQFGTGAPFNPAEPAIDIEGASFIDVDAGGNVFISGKYFDKARFDDIIVPSDGFIKKVELGNIFVARLSPDGVAQWVKTASSELGSMVTGFSADSKGNTYLYGALSFKKGQFNGENVKGPFVAKTNKDGNIEWIEDAVTRTKSSKIIINWPAGLAINASEDRIYTTGNATKKTTEYTDFQGSTATTTETIIAVTKIITD